MLAANSWPTIYIYICNRMPRANVLSNYGSTVGYVAIGPEKKL